MKRKRPPRTGPAPAAGQRPAGPDVRPPREGERPLPTGGGRQTASYLQGMLQAHGLRPRRQYGQNFLIDLNLLTLIVEAARIKPTDVVLEVGTGTGGLTNRLSQAAAQVVSIEIDPGFFKLATAETAACDNVRIVHTDVLHNKNTIQPAVIDALRSAMDGAAADDYLLVANLPYDVSAMVIANLLLHELPVRSMTVTVQHEMGERIVAQPGSKDYGPLSVLVATLGRVEWVRTLPPQVFWPRPQITSAILHIVPQRRAKFARTAESLAALRRFNLFTRHLFAHRRKGLRAALIRVPGGKEHKKEIDPLLESLGLMPNVRAEQMTPDELHRLWAALEAMQALPELDG